MEITWKLRKLGFLWTVRLESASSKSLNTVLQLGKSVIKIITIEVWKKFQKI